jgi:hypothetical protein
MQVVFIYSDEKIKNWIVAITPSLLTNCLYYVFSDESEAKKKLDGSKERFR